MKKEGEEGGREGGAANRKGLAGRQGRYTWGVMGHDQGRGGGCGGGGSFA